MEIITLSIFLITTSFLHSCFEEETWPKDERTTASREQKQETRRTFQMGYQPQ